MSTESILGFLQNQNLLYVFINNLNFLNIFQHFLKYWRDLNLFSLNVLRFFLKVLFKFLSLFIFIYANVSVSSMGEEEDPASQVL